MKKILAMLLALVLCFGLAACGGGEEEPAVDEEGNVEEVAVQDIEFYGIGMQVPDYFVFDEESSTDIANYYNYADEDGVVSSQLYLGTSDDNIPATDEELDGLLDSFIEGFLNNDAISDVSEVSDTELNGNPAKQIEYTYSNEAGDFYGTTYAVHSNDHLVGITFMSLSDDTSEFDEMLSTIEWYEE